MIPVAEALERILADVEPLPVEQVALLDGLGRILARDVAARRTQPPMAVSAMDGYAVRSDDVAHVPVELRRIGSIPAGSLFEGRLGPGETVRIFTGAALPEGADAVVIQEDTTTDGERITALESVGPGRHVRAAGIDFREGDVGLSAGRRLTARDIGFAAAMNVPWLTVRQRPRVAILATGDEIALPGDPLAPGQIVSSNGPALHALVRACGGEPVDLGVAADSEAAIAERVAGAAGAHVLVTTGGASVGDHDLVQPALKRIGMTVDFWKIAMRPGKPLMYGRLGPARVLGLPGNPVSSMVCALLFLRPLLARLAGAADPAGEGRGTARLGRALPENDRREDYLRATLERDADGGLVAHPFAVQDSSLLGALARADALVLRPAHAPAAAAGETVPILRLT
ncbi:MAG: gephyrin-like molybdotransferase Glp [Alphaproteobacteria bacterium]